VCLSAALHKLSTPTAQERCVNDLVIMEPKLSREEAAQACLVNPDWDELCRDCVRLRSTRRCPAWPETKPP
jgi:hypothetical protein